MTSPTHGASAPDPNRLHHFEVAADLCPQAMLRILGLVAQLSLIPRSIASERQEGRLHVQIAIDGLSIERAEILLAKILTIVTVREARMTSG